MTAKLKFFLIFAGTTLYFLSTASWVFADTVYFKDGRVWNGIIQKESSTHVELDLGFDVAHLEKFKILRVARSSPQEKRRLQSFLHTEKIKKEKILTKRKSEPESIKYSHENGHVFVDVLINGKTRAHLLLDTGASVVTLSTRFAKKLGIKSEQMQIRVPLGVADGRKLQGSLLKLDSVKLGHAEIKNVTAVVLLNEKAETNFGDGLLGMSFLKFFNFKIDPKKKILILERNS